MFAFRTTAFVAKGQLRVRRTRKEVGSCKKEIVLIKHMQISLLCMESTYFINVLLYSMNICSWGEELYCPLENDCFPLWNVYF